MKITFFSTQPYDKDFFNRHNKDFGFSFEFLETGLDEKTVELVKKSVAVCVFVNDKVSSGIIQDDVISRLISFPNVLITAHQGFFTNEALRQIAEVTLSNIDGILKSQKIEMANSLV
jgi:lactate dehydrogenase-like 2-hydroxyacid dehydrogenase